MCPYSTYPVFSGIGFYKHTSLLRRFRGTLLIEIGSKVNYFSLQLAVFTTLNFISPKAKKKIMSTQESARDVPTNTLEDLVDSDLPYKIPLSSDHTNFDGAIRVRKKDIEKLSFTYFMRHPKRGIALIINNEEFDPHTKMNSRTGSTRDVEQLKKVLVDKLEFNVIIRNNMTVKQMKNIFEDISMTDHTQNDCFLCVILSHGEDGGIIYGTDGSVNLNDLISYILPNKCTSLTGKPKLFFVQACRGTKLDKGTEMKDAIGSFGAHATPVQKIPLWADVLIAYSSVPGHYSWRNSISGSWFIQSLCYILEQCGSELEIHQIMTKVNYHVAYNYESKSNDYQKNRMKQVPYVASMLTKELKFSPKEPAISEKH